MSKRKKTVVPISGAQDPTTEEQILQGSEIVVDADATGPVAEADHAPPGDAPTEIIETHIPGIAPEKRPELELSGNFVFRALQLMREGLRPSNLKSSYGRTPLVMIMIIAMVGTFGNAFYSVALPEIQRDLEINLTDLIIVLNYIGLVAALFSIPLGYLGDRYRRVTIYGLGGVFGSLGQVVTSAATGKPILITGLGIDTVGGLGPSAVGFGLIADYVPPESRGQSFAFRASAESLIAIIAPLAGGFIAKAYGWRLPYLIVGILGIVVSLLFLRMPEPIRGYHERKAWGADEATARRAQEPPSMGEAFRAAWGVRTLRRISYSIPFNNIASRGFGIFFGFYLARTHGVDIAGRGIFAAAAAFAGLLGLTLGGPLTDRIMGRNPGRVVMIAGGASIVTGVSYVGLALAPSAAWVFGIALIVQFATTIIEPAQYTVSSLVIPPRLRNLGIATLRYWTIPIYFIFPILAGIAGRNGFRAALLFFVPFSIIGGIIYITAGPYVEFDMRSATAAAMASEEWRRAKEEGRGKLLVLRDVDVHYETVQVLFGVNLDVPEGELIALLGTNGAGKSTLLRALSGTQEASGGAIVFDGKDITHVPPHEIAREGVAQTPGGRGIFPGLSVRENLQLAGWIYGQDAKHKEDVQKIFEYFPVLRDRLDQLAGSLSGGEQQMLTLSQAFLARPKLLMIDELSLGLSPAIVEQLLGIVRAIHAQGTTIMIVEQSVNVALTLAERAIFMEKGEIRFDGPTADLLDRPDIMRAVFLKAGAGITVAGGAAPVLIDERDRANILEVRGLTKRYGGVTAVSDVSFNLREFESLGLIGPNGAGKTTVLEMVSGFNLPDAGHVIFNGRDITVLPPNERAKLGLIRRFQDAKLFPSLTVIETIALAFERQHEVRSVILHGLGAPQARQAEARIRTKVDRLIELFNLEAFADKFVSEVSTGTRRIIDIACVFATEPRVLLLDEPSSGLAQREAENLAPLLNQVRRETGCSLVVIEHDMPLISAVSDELIAMDLGEIVMRGTPDEVLNDERVVRSYLGTTEEVINRSGRVEKTK